MRTLAAGARVGEVWLTRVVHLTMNRSEAPAEQRPARALPGLVQPIATYQLVRVPGALPYGGKHAGRVPAARRALEPVHTALASIEVAGETEGRLRAVVRVMLAGLALLLVGGAEHGAGGLHALLHRVWRRSDGGPRQLRQALGATLGGLEQARRAAARHTPWLSLALRRPSQRRPRPPARRPSEG
ncbi:MAG: hypothetical protein QM767_04140 [Anaeromyxobacter sp.]